MYKNAEGYPDPTQGEGIRRANRIPEHIWESIRLARELLRLVKLDVVSIEVETGRRRSGISGGGDPDGQEYSGRLHRLLRAAERDRKRHSAAPEEKENHHSDECIRE